MTGRNTIHLPHAKRNRDRHCVCDVVLSVLPVRLDAVVAGGLPSIDVEDLAGHKACAIEIDHRIGNVGDLSHAACGMECSQCLMRFRRMHRRLDDSR